jgi:hypothetical protein
MPNAVEAFARVLLRGLGVSFYAYSPLPNESGVPVFDDDAPLFRTGNFLENAEFKLEGDEFHIKISGRPLDPNFLADKNISSMVDLLDHRIALSTHIVMFHYPKGDSVQAGKLKVLLNGGARLDRFALTFPHRRDIIFNGSVVKDELTGFAEVPLPKNEGVVYMRRLPHTVEELPVTDRRGP